MSQRPPQLGRILSATTMLPHAHAVIAHRKVPGRDRYWWECLPPSECTEKDGDVTAIFGNVVASPGMLPMDCPNCGRMRLNILMTDKPSVIVYCDKCGAREWDCERSVHGTAGAPHPQKASAWVEVW